MGIIFFLLGCSLVLALGFLAAFLWSVRSGQYEDMETPGMRVLFEDSRSTAHTQSARTAVETDLAADTAAPATSHTACQQQNRQQTPGHTLPHPATETALHHPGRQAETLHT